MEEIFDLARQLAILHEESYKRFKLDINYSKKCVSIVQL